jgi:membrane peptidoglycan carboxypeptidase
MGKLINFGVSLLDVAGKAQMCESMAMTGIYFEPHEVENLEDDRRHKLTKMVSVSKEKTFDNGVKFLEKRRHKSVYKNSRLATRKSTAAWAGPWHSQRP